MLYITPQCLDAPTCYAFLKMLAETSSTAKSKPDAAQLWCATCAKVVSDPLVCGDCSAVICRVCGTSLECPDELAFG